MEFNFIGDGIDAVVIDNFYTESQLEEIHTELKWLTKPSIMLKEDKLVPAKNKNGENLTSKNGVFLENIFVEWTHSALISHSMKQMECKEFKDNILNFNTLFKSLFACNSRCHLLSYYENSDYYKPQLDAFFFTILTYFNQEPKKFTGGNINLYSVNSEKKATIEPKNNRIIIIASCTTHEVEPITSNIDKSLSGFGRYCNAIFLNYTDSREIKNNDTN